MVKRFLPSVLLPFCFLMICCATFGQAPIPGPVRDLDFTAAGITASLQTFANGDDVILLRSQGQEMALILNLKQYDCPEDQASRKIHATGSMRYSGFEGGRPVQFNLLINLQPNGGSVYELTPLVRIRDLVSALQNSPFMERIEIPEEPVRFAFNPVFQIILFRETALNLSQRLAYDLLSSLVEPVAGTGSPGVLIGYVRTNCTLSRVSVPQASLTVECVDGKKYTVNTGTGGGSCNSYGDGSFECSDTGGNSGASGNCTDWCKRSWGRGSCKPG